MMMLIVGLDLLRDRHVREEAVLGVITLITLAGLARQAEARARARLAAWVDAAPSLARSGTS